MLRQTFPLTVTKKDSCDSYILYEKKRNIWLRFSKIYFLNYSQFIGFLREESKIHPCTPHINIALKSFFFSVLYTKPVRDLLHFTYDLEFLFSNIMCWGFVIASLCPLYSILSFFPLYFIYILVAAFYKYKVPLKPFNQSLNIYSYILIHHLKIIKK